MKVLVEDEAKALLKRYGIPTTKYEVVRSRENLGRLRLDYPLVMKVRSPNILHKTEVGGIVLDIKNQEDLLKAYELMRARFPEEVLVVESMEKGIELIIGLIDDPTFGLAIMFGLGGVFTEVLRDVSFRVVPITRWDAKQMLEELKAKQILEGFRGIKVNKEALIALLLKTSKLGEDLDLEQLDMNPVFAREDGVCVADAKIIFKSDRDC